MDHEYEDVLRAMSDKLAAEITISLAWGAAQSYRHDSILRPFPSTYANLNDRDREKDIDGLVRCMACNLCNLAFISKFNSMRVLFNSMRVL